MSLSILVIGAENPRIRDLFREVGRYATVSYLNTEPITRKPEFETLIRSWRWRRHNGSPPEANLVIPKRWAGVSRALMHWFCRKSFSQIGKPDVIVFTWPQLAPLAENLSDAIRVYYCKDPFEHWTSWNREEIRELESRLLANSDAVFAVSRLLSEEFGPRTNGKVFYLPNGLENSFLNAGDLPRPANMPTGKPIIGSIGQINDTYDWEYIAELAAGMPEALLYFVGNIEEGNPYLRQNVMKHLTETPNILWVDRQPHDQIPAYMQHFDISMCFLKADEFGDRRSPLRLYDYLTTNRPIISTAVREAYEHVPHVNIARTGKDAVVLARRILAGELPVDHAARREYVSHQTWSDRAREFLDGLQQIPALARAMAQDQNEQAAGKVAVTA